MLNIAKDILVYIETTANDGIAQVTLELASCANELTKKLDGARVVGIVCTSTTLNDNSFEQLSNVGLDEVFILEHNELNQYTTANHLSAVLEALTTINPYIFLVGATKQGRDLAPAIATRLNTGLVADCIELRINEKGLLEATRPTFGDSLMATILSKTLPQMATVRPGVLNIQTVLPQKELKQTLLTPNLSDIENKVKIIDFTPFIQDSEIDITKSEILVVGGMGIKSKQGFEKLNQLAKLLNAKVGATRLAVEAGFAPISSQVGQTGTTVAPKLYIAFGVAGAIQHKVGMEKSGTIIAINNDPDAPIYDICDHFICEDAINIVDTWIEHARKIQTTT